MNFIKNMFVMLALFFSFLISSAYSGENVLSKVYVTNQGSDTVTVIDADKFKVIKTIDVEDYPHNVNHTPDGRKVLVTNKNINLKKNPALLVIDTHTDKVVARIGDIGKRIEHVVAPADDGFAFVTEDLGNNAVAVVNMTSGEIASMIPVGIKPHGLWHAPDGKYIFVPNQLSGTVSKIDVAKGEVLAETEVGRTPTMVVVTPDGNKVFATLFGERGVAVIDARNSESGKLQVIDVIPVGERPAQVAVTSDGKYVLVPCEGKGGLYVIDQRDHRIKHFISTGKKAHGVDISDDNKYAFVSNWDDNTLSVVDLTLMKVKKQIKVGNSPAGVDFIKVD